MTDLAWSPPEEAGIRLHLAPAACGYPVRSLLDIRNGADKLRDRPRGHIAHRSSAASIAGHTDVAIQDWRYHSTHAVTERYLSTCVIQDVVPIAWPRAVEVFNFLPSHPVLGLARMYGSGL